MRRTLPFILVAMGTLGLLVAEWVDLGRAFTLAFAGVNLVGLVGIGMALFARGSSEGAPEH